MVISRTKIGWKLWLLAGVFLASAFAIGKLATAQAASPTSSPTSSQVTSLLSSQATPKTTRVAPYVYILSPKNGERVTQSVRVIFGLRGFDIAPAGVEKEGTGHHHLLIDAPLPSFTEPIPADDQYRHFGGGQTETVITLEPGEHILRLVLGDAGHVPIPGGASEPIRIEVIPDP